MGAADSNRQQQVAAGRRLEDEVWLHVFNRLMMPLESDCLLSILLCKGSLFILFIANCFN